MTRNLILLLGDQLTQSISSLRGTDPAFDVVLMCEMRREASYVPHHKKKLALIFSSMRLFAGELSAAGWHVDYHTIEQTGGAGSLTRAGKRRCATRPHSGSLSHRPASGASSMSCSTGGARRACASKFSTMIASFAQSPELRTCAATLSSMNAADDAARARQPGLRFAALTNSTTRCGLSGVSLIRTPNGESACSTAPTIAAMAAMVPPSPAPFTPSGLSGDGVSV